MPRSGGCPSRGAPFCTCLEFLLLTKTKRLRCRSFVGEDIQYRPTSGNLRDVDVMREVHRRQCELGQVPVEKIWIDPKSRDDIPAVLKGLQHIWSDEALRARLFALLDEHVLPETDREVGRPGMELWRILVLGVLKQGLSCDFDRLHDLANHHETVRAFLGHGDFGDKTYYEYQTVLDNVCLLTPELLSEVGRLVVESGHAVAKKTLASHCAGGVTRSWWKRTCITRRMSGRV